MALQSHTRHRLGCVEPLVQGLAYPGPRLWPAVLRSSTPSSGGWPIRLGRSLAQGAIHTAPQLPKCQGVERGHAHRAGKDVAQRDGQQVLQQEPAPGHALHACRGARRAKREVCYPEGHAKSGIAPGSSLHYHPWHGACSPSQGPSPVRMPSGMITILAMQCSNPTAMKAETGPCAAPAGSRQALGARLGSQAAGPAGKQTSLLAGRRDEWITMAEAQHGTALHRVRSPACLLPNRAASAGGKATAEHNSLHICLP